MKNSKLIKIIIPLIAVIIIGLVIGNTTKSTDNQVLVTNEESVNFTLTNDNSIDPNKSNLTETKQPYMVGEPKITRTLPIIETIDKDKIVGKNIPSNYTFGNFFDNGLLVGMGTTYIENPNQIHSIRFTNKHGGEINAITLDLLLNAPSEIVVGIQDDNGEGFPNGKWKNENSFTKLMISSTQGRSTFVLPENYKVEKGKVYHIIVELAPTSQNLMTNTLPKNEKDYNPIIIIHYKVNTPFQPFNPDDPDIYWPDSFINSLHYNGTGWSILDKWPVYLLSYADGTVDGQPYTLKAHWVVQDSHPVGETIIPHSNYQIAKLGFVVNKVGNPSDDLFYGIRDHANKILSSGVFATSDKLTDQLSFIEITLPQPIEITTGNLYNFYVYSPIPRGDDHYNLWGHEFSLNSTVGYGGQYHRLTTGSNFEKWGPWYDADAVFSLTTK